MTAEKSKITRIVIMTFLFLLFGNVVNDINIYEILYLLILLFFISKYNFEVKK